MAWGLGVDTSVWVEGLLEQCRSGEVEGFLVHVRSEQLYCTDFALHSVALILGRLRRREEFLLFVQRLFIDGRVNLLRRGPPDMARVVGAMDRFSLDFDDAYQYTAAEREDLTVVSFDSDFDRTDRGRKTPAQVLSG